MGSLGGAVVLIIVGVVIGFFIMYKLFFSEKRRRRLLEHCLGEAVYAGTFSLKEAKDWIKEREKLIKDGGKAVVFKVNNRTLKMFSKEFKLNFEMEKYLAIAIVKDANVTDSLLVKYEQLNPQLEDLLAKGDGVFVVNA